MNYDIPEIKLRIINTNAKARQIIGAYLQINLSDYIINFKIICYLGKGAIGHVYLIERIFKN